MVKLYDMNTRKFIDKYPSEYQLIKTIEPTMSDDKKYMIISIKNNTPSMYGIRSIKDFEIYKNNFNRKMILEKSCIELKKEILELDEKRKQR